MTDVPSLCQYGGFRVPWYGYLILCSPNKSLMYIKYIFYHVNFIRHLILPRLLYLKKSLYANFPRSRELLIRLSNTNKVDYHTSEAQCFTQQ